MGKRIFDFFIFSNLFIAGCAVAMVLQTYTLLLQSPPDIDFLLFVFFSTICSYSFHWWLTPPQDMPVLVSDKSPGSETARLRWMEKFRTVHLILLVAGGGGAAIYFFKLLPYWPWLLLSAFITFLYSAPKIPHPWFRALRKVALGKTIFLALVWMNVTTLLPLLISGEDWRPDFTLFVIGRFFMIYAICILFDYRDREHDRLAGIRSLITYLSDKGIYYLFLFSLFVFFSTSVALYWFDHSIMIISILLIPGVITAFLYQKATRHFSDLFYYFVLDGLMALSALVMLIPGNWLTLPSK